MSAPTTRKPTLTRAAALFVALALVVLGVVCLVRADQLRTSGPSADRALVDSAATGEVIGQVSTALNAVLSYDYTKPQVAQQAATTWLTGDAPKQYDTLFTQLQKLAAGQKLTLVAKVVKAGVTQLHGNSAQLLVFLDQESTRASDQQSSVSAAQVQISAVKQGGTWRISELKPL